MTTTIQGELCARCRMNVEAAAQQVVWMGRVSHLTCFVNWFERRNGRRPLMRQIGAQRFEPDEPA